MEQKWYAVGSKTHARRVFAACQTAAGAFQPRLVYIISPNGNGELMDKYLKLKPTSLFFGKDYPVVCVCFLTMVTHHLKKNEF